MATLTAKVVIATIDAGIKASTVFKKFIGFPSADPADMEAKYQLILDANTGTAKVTKERGDAIRSLMAWCRAHHDAPYSKSKKGELSDRKPPAKKGANAGKGKGKGKGKGMLDIDPNPPADITNVQLVDQFYALALKTLSAPELTTLETLIKAMQHAKLYKDAKKSK